MRKYLLSAAVFGLAVAGAVSVSSTPASAGPVCLTDQDSPNTFRSCNFYSFSECRASSRGVGGSCVRNVGQHGGYGDDDYYNGDEAVAVPYGRSYNRYDGPVVGGYVRSYGW